VHYLANRKAEKRCERSCYSVKLHLGLHQVLLGGLDAVAVAASEQLRRMVSG